MSSCTECIANNKESIIILFVFSNFGFKNIIDFDLTKITISLDNRYSQEILKLLVVSAHHRCVVFKIYLFACFDSIGRDP